MSSGCEVGAEVSKDKSSRSNIAFCSVSNTTNIQNEGLPKIDFVRAALTHGSAKAKGIRSESSLARAGSMSPHRKGTHVLGGNESPTKVDIGVDLGP